MDLVSESSRIFISCQHKFRGIIADFKSKKFEKNPRFGKSFKFRSSYRNHMLEARSALHTSSFTDYLSWASSQIKQQLPELSRYPTGYDELEGVSIHAPLVTLEREVFWIVARISEDSEAINNFRKAAELIEKLWINGYIDESIDVLKLFDESHGSSFWSVQLRIALENAAGGLEKQKKYTSEVRSIYKSGLLNFIAYNTSVRNEERVGIQKFKEDIRQKITNHSKYGEAVKIYMHHRMLGEWPSTSERVADVLRIEQSHSLVDVYETFVNLAQHVVSNNENPELKGIVRTALIQTKGIDDFRLKKARLFFNIDDNFSNLPKREESGAEALFSGDLVQAAKILRTQRKSKTVDAWAYIYSGILYSQTKCKSISTSPQSIPKLIGQILRQDLSSADAYSALLKLTVNLCGLPLATAISSFMKFIYREQPDQSWQPELPSLNTAYLGCEDLLSSSMSLSGGIASRCWALLKNPAQHTEADGYSASIFRATGYLAINKFDQALTTLNEIEQKPKTLISGIDIPLLLHAQYAAGNKGEVIRLIALEGSNCESKLSLIPIKNTLAGYSTRDFDYITDWLIAPTALYMLWDITENDTTASHLRFKIGQIIRRKEVRNPAKLNFLQGLVPDHLLVYFLRNVCVPSLIDQARVVSTTAEVLDQRLDVCSVLRELDVENSDVYETEIYEITNRQILETGQRIVDGTRIHVDAEALARWATRELQEDYYRYRDLAQVVTTLEFDDVMEDLLIDGQLPNSASSFDEADAVLYSLLTKISHEFLNNSLFGLDYYLSKRIRHQSFIGLIRGPLQLQQLITTKEADDKRYNDNNVWLEKFTDCGKENLRNLSSEFQKFSLNFDQALLDAKDKKLQILSKEQPLGLFHLEISPQIIPVVRILLQDSDLSNFVKGFISILWAYLENSLRDARKLLSEELKSQITFIFDDFRASIKRIAPNSTSHHELDRTLGECSVDVQRALDDATSWFHKINDSEALRKTFDIEQALAISIKAAKKCLRGFDPEIKTNFVNNNLQLMPSTLVFLHDVLFVSLDNARIHSGLKQPTITISVEPDVHGGTFTISVTCDSKPSIRAAAEKKLTEIRTKIDRQEYVTKTKTEGGSGLYKIAAVVKQSAKGILKFGFNKDGQFSIRVTYNFLVQTRQAAEAK
ncbi:hypothetical protein [Pseudomonas sp. RL_15y_Pfl2_60]|uniref:hypothetical protein n=1 Tax=Pseudomonas sp. RL_15y_Pfl2_60 TaxID=3088709 RepID=UPI0030DA9804